MSKNAQTVKKTETTETVEAPQTEKVNRILKNNVDIKGLYEQLKTHSAVIRDLHAKGYTRSEIASALGKRYQHVRNVLVQDAQKASDTATK